MEYVISRPSSIVTDKRGRIRFAGTDAETVQWAIDKIAEDQAKWHNRVLRWLGFGKTARVNIDCDLHVMDDIDLAGNVELRGSASTVIEDERKSTP